MSVHSIPWEREHSDPRVQRVVDAALWRSLDAVAGATQVVGEGLVSKRGMPERLYRLLPYGMPVPDGIEEAAALRAQLAPDGELLVGMVSATADPGKGHAVLRDAITQAQAPVRAVMVGADPGAGFGADGVTVAGRVPSVGPYLHAVDVLAVPSTAWESLPLVILEAMAAGKPVFGSRLAGIPEAIEDGVTGALFPPGDAAALARLLTGADRGALERMGAAGRAAWERRFSPERMVEGVLGLYRELDSAAR
jgi:glycosyltransferase involved in cell wall biosynthesis